MFPENASSVNAPLPSTLRESFHLSSILLLPPSELIHLYKEAQQNLLATPLTSLWIPSPILFSSVTLAPYVTVLQ